MDKTIAKKVEGIFKFPVLTEDVVEDSPLLLLLEKRFKQLFDKTFSDGKATFHLFFLVKSDFNAYALSIDDNAIICLTIGAIDRICEVIAQIADSDEYLLEFGNPESSKLIASLIIYSLNFSLFHEVAHLICGHVDYLSSSDNNSFLAQNSEVNPENLFDRQTLELQADIFAANLFRNQFMIDEKRIDLYLLKTVISAVYILFELVYLSDDSGFSMEKIYLPAKYRIVNILTMLEVNITDEIKPLLMRIISATEKELRKFCNKTISRQIKNDLDFSRIDKHVKSLVEHWKNIYTELKPYTNVQLKPDIYNGAEYKL